VATGVYAPRYISSVKPIHGMSAISDKEKVSFDLLRRIQFRAETQLGISTIEDALAANNVSLTLNWIHRHDPPDAEQFDSLLGIYKNDIPVLTLNAADVVRKPTKELRQLPGRISPLLALYFAKTRPQTKSTTIIVQGHISWLDDISEVLKKSFDPCVKFGENGAFSLRLDVPLFESCYQKLVDDLDALIRITAMISDLRKRDITCSTSTLRQLTFIYAEATATSTELSGEFGLGKDSKDNTLVLHPVATNPHQRIHEHILTDFETSPIGKCLLLKVSLPPMRALSRAELNGKCQIRALKRTHYRMIYRSIPTVYEIQSKSIKGILEWHIWETKVNQVNRARPKEWEEALGKLFNPKESDLRTTPAAQDGQSSKAAGGPRGMKQLIICDTATVEKAIDDLDSTLRELLQKHPLPEPSAAASGPHGQHAANQSGQQQMQNAQANMRQQMQGNVQMQRMMSAQAARMQPNGMYGQSQNRGQPQTGQRRPGPNDVVVVD